jgi:hypothetical protein
LFSLWLKCRVTIDSKNVTQLDIIVAKLEITYQRDWRVLAILFFIVGE